jgi:hypothetical protein
MVVVYCRRIGAQAVGSIGVDRFVVLDRNVTLELTAVVTHVTWHPTACGYSIVILSKEDVCELGLVGVTSGD